jgi:hypothetical protein
MQPPHRNIAYRSTDYESHFAGLFGAPERKNQDFAPGKSMPRYTTAPVSSLASTDSLQGAAELVDQAVEAIGEAQALQADGGSAKQCARQLAWTLAWARLWSFMR